MILIDNISDLFGFEISVSTINIADYFSGLLQLNSIEFLRSYYVVVLFPGNSQNH